MLKLARQWADCVAILKEATGTLTNVVNLVSIPHKLLNVVATFVWEMSLALRSASTFGRQQ
jgi:hypothetical protein